MTHKRKIYTRSDLLKEFLPALPAWQKKINEHNKNQSPIDFSSSIYRIRNFLQWCEELIGTIPEKEDNIIQKGLKVAAISDRLIGYIYNDKNLYSNFAKKNDLSFKNDWAFLHVMFSTDIHSSFNEELITLNEHRNKRLLKLSSEFGDIYVTEQSFESHAGSSAKSPQAIDNIDGVSAFWYSPKFDFDGVLSELWLKFENRINIHIKNGEVQYSAIAVSKDPFCGKSAELVNILSDKHLKYKEDNVPRVCLFVGPPGVGKSTLVFKIAQNIGTKTLRLEAEAFRALTPSFMKFLFGGLKPDSLIIDDVDRTSFDHITTMFTILDWIKLEYPYVSTFMTANRVSHLDSAFVRPGRIDEVLWFQLPDEDDILVLLNTYLDFYNISCSDHDKKKIVKAAEGLAVPWIKEIALQLRYESLDSVLGLIDSMKKLKGDVSFNYGLDKEETYQKQNYLLKKTIC